MLMLRRPRGPAAIIAVYRLATQRGRLGGMTVRARLRQSGNFGLSFLHAGASRSRKREGVMKTIHWIIAAAALASAQPTPASAGVNDPEVIIYRVPGVRDDGGGSGVGVATVFVCTNFSGAEENLRKIGRAHV